MEQRKKAGLVLLGLAAAVLAVAVASAIRSGRDSSDGEVRGNVYTEVPDGDFEKVTDSKSDAYMTYRTASSDIEDYWDSCEEEIIAEAEESKPASGPSQATSEDLFGGVTAPPTRPSSGGGNPYRETPEQREARHQRRREEAIELADRMQRGQQEDGREAPAATEVTPQTIEIPSGDVRRSDAVSSLDGWTDGSVSSLDSPEAEIPDDATHPFRCMFVRDERIKNGQRVSVRLLEDIVVGGTLVPKNTHIMASCSINARLEMEITNIEMQGRILSLGYEAYDTDGVKGIYCPDAGSAGSTARNRGTSLAGTMLSSRVGRLASDIVSTGVSLAQTASGERTVSVPAGYTFYIVKKRQQ